uniref:MAM domain-containing protein n=1 Tax=Soboliphyme baturini TaxID=241478 RepID=A0A183J654_9BILA
LLAFSLNAKQCSPSASEGRPDGGVDADVDIAAGTEEDTFWSRESGETALSDDGQLLGVQRIAEGQLVENDGGCGAGGWSGDMMMSSSLGSTCALYWLCFFEIHYPSFLPWNNSRDLKDEPTNSYLSIASLRYALSKTVSIFGTRPTRRWIFIGRLNGGTDRESASMPHTRAINNAFAGTVVDVPPDAASGHCPSLAIKSGDLTQWY